MSNIFNLSLIKAAAKVETEIKPSEENKQESLTMEDASKDSKAIKQVFVMLHMIIWYFSFN